QPGGGDCEPACEAGWTCVDDACVEDAPEDCDPACEAGWTCVDDACVEDAPEDCDPACADGEACVDGVCEACAPTCDGFACGGDDGCGGACEADSCATSCPDGEVATCEDGACACCTLDCAGKACGDDGCGGECGTCTAGEICSEMFQCVDPASECTCLEGQVCVDGECCTPDCGGCPPDVTCDDPVKECGPDGCGGT
ncbi:MAG: hypothetical protein QF464_24610, partial [Myxococcota bacterium]|nr:hypothetical protein [Myxococcota bacterium]